ncbi:MAG: exodeoxyribonuclease VII large subunit [Candidatus Liptonbacteria bacterium]|nr:exodeoxyribonuclease VII large subunit [Candidatus Liptonbacteria bacterium]
MKERKKKDHAELFLEKIFTVAEYIEFLNIFFKQQEARILGEVSQCQIASSGHVYFTVKDKSGNGVLDCIMWKNTYTLCGLKLEIGMEIIVSGHPNIYPNTGRFSIIVDAVELVGEGALKKAYDALKKKLEEEGLFDEARKRPIPDFVHKIGVITSRGGAVIHDFVNNLGKFGFKVLLADSRVEGQTALKDLHSAIQAMRKENIDVLVIIRGGGSLESLQAFNNEALVREIVDFPVPVIAGIGHDKDVPLLALAADYMTSTPTAAAHLLNKSWEEAYAKIHQVAYLMTRMTQEFKRIRADLDLAWSSVRDHTEKQIEWLKEQLNFAKQSIKLNDPVRQLKLGYSIVRQNGKILRSIKGIKKGDGLDTQLADGTIQSRVERFD